MAQRGAKGSKAAALLAAVPREAAPGVTGGGDWFSGVSSFAFQVPTFASRQTAVWVPLAMAALHPACHVATTNGSDAHGGITSGGDAFGGTLE